MSSGHRPPSPPGPPGRGVGGEGRSFAATWAARLAIVATLGALFVIAAPTAAHAQDDEAARARAAFDRGTRRFTARRYDQALEAFLEAHSITPHPAVLFNIASCYDKLDRATEAVNTYQRYLRERGDEVEPGRRRDVQTALARLRRQVALLHIVPPDQDAPVTLDGEPLELGDDPWAVAPGTYVIASRASDGREAREEVGAVAGETVEVTLTFPEPEGNGGGGNGGGGGDGGDDGGDGGNGDGGDRMSRPSRGWSPSLRWIGVGATVLFAGAWVYTGLQALSLNADYEETPDQDIRDEGLTYRVLADFVFMPTTILAAGFTVLAFILADGGETERPAEGTTSAPVLTPTLTAEGVGLGVTGVF